MIRITTLLAAAAAVVALPASAAAQAPPQLQPLHAGDYWIYQAQSISGETQQHVVRVTDVAGGWYRVDGHPIVGDAWMAHTAGSVVYFAGAVLVVLDGSATVGSSWTCAASPYDVTLTLLSTSAAVSTPAGGFANALFYGAVTAAADAGLTSLVVAPGVGIVKYTTLTTAGALTYRLLRARVDGVDYPRPQVSR
ncbi:MAG: hypothetical protein KC503_32730 [Myxococcales bacterium]|nr:hypothetical protein [Myxococcales bacterium]